MSNLTPQRVLTVMQGMVLFERRGSSSKQASLLRWPEKLLDDSHLGGPFVLRQALHEHASILFLQNAVIEQTEQSAIVQRPDQPSETLFQYDHRSRHLILKKSIPAIGIDRLHPRRHHRIAGHSKWQAVNDHATQLLALHVHTLPER